MRIFNHLQQALGPQVGSGPDACLYFGGTAYLGIPRDENFLKYYLEGIRIFGLNNGTSRANNVQLGIYDEAESIAASRFGAENALITSSGYLAAQMTLNHFKHWGEALYAPDTHPALWINGRPEVHLPFEQWKEEIIQTIQNSSKKHWVVISNGLNNLLPERYDFSFLSRLSQDKQILLIVDDSHAIGILNGGLGNYKTLPRKKNIHVLVLASMAKALGVDAGLILGSNALIRSLKQTNEFQGASPPSAAGLFAFMQSEQLYLRQQEKLLELSGYFLKQLDAFGHHFSYTDDFPVYLSRRDGMSDLLLKQNILISSFAYPDRTGPLLDRIVLSSWHEKKDLDFLLAKLKAWN